MDYGQICGTTHSFTRQKLKNWTHPKIKNAHPVQKTQIINEIERFHGGLTPHIIQVCKLMSGPSKKLKIVDPEIQKNKKYKIGLK